MVEAMAQEARKASLVLATLPQENKNRALSILADLIVNNEAMLLSENEKDIEAGQKSGLTKALLDRLRFTSKRIAGMAEGIKQVIDLPDPVGEVIEKSTRPNGLELHKVRVPIGVIGIIYESRPNVTVDCAILCLKSGNACILRGGKEAFYSNTALASLVQQALKQAGLPAGTVQLIPTTDRIALSSLLRMNDYVHCIIPRGGEGLIKFCAENSLIPVIKHYKGVCCVYIDRYADEDMAVSIAVNAKVQRPSVCNASENLFIHPKAAIVYLPRIAQELSQAGVELRLDGASEGILLGENNLNIKAATEEDYYEEYLDYILSVKIVNDVDEAIMAVNKYGSAHSDCIVTENEENAQKFLLGVDSSTVYWNASTRFTDGFEFGLGAEIGISTDKLHARGPMGLRELTTYKYLIYGKGQIRG